MNITRSKYKGLSFLEDGGHVKVDDRKNGILVRWLKDSLVDSGEGSDITHEKFMQVMLSRNRKAMRDNVVYFAEPVVRMAMENCQKMIDVVREEWLKNQNGVVLMPDGSLITYIIHNVPEERRNLYKQEQCIGTAVFTLISPDGEMLACALCSSRLEYEGDGKRKLMYDASIPAKIAGTVFSPILCILAFLQYAETEKVYIENGQKKKQREGTVVNSTGMRVKFVDYRYLREIIRLEGFKVKGHFRMQPFGKGRGEKKLIYINEFEKHGYHRRAGRQIEEGKA